MADPMRIRATEPPTAIDVRVLMSHEMETGQRKDSAGKVIPAWFIQTVTAHAQRQAGADRRVGPGGLEEPVPAVQVQGRRKTGDKITVTWVDNKGDKRTDEATIN